MPNLTPPGPMRRSRPLYLLLVLLVIALGLGSRRYRGELPVLLGAYAGDVLWAAMVFLLAAFLWHRARRRSLIVVAAAFCLAVEVSQLYHAPWIDAIRNTRIGALVLGHTFIANDLVCYLIGIAAAALLDAWICRWPRTGLSMARATQTGPVGNVADREHGSVEMRGPRWP